MVAASATSRPRSWLLTRWEPRRGASLLLDEAGEAPSAGTSLTLPAIRPPPAERQSFRRPCSVHPALGGQAECEPLLPWQRFPLD